MDFRLDVIGEGAAVALCPIGTIDRHAAGVLLEALAAVRLEAGVLVAVHLDRVDRVTEDGRAVLARAHVAFDPGAVGGVGTTTLSRSGARPLEG